MGWTAGGRWVPSPGVSYGDPGPHGRPQARPQPAQPSERITGTPDPTWGPNPLSGPRTIRIGDASFQIPREAAVKRSGRAGTAWVHFREETFVFSELGVLVQTPAERRATPWELL